MSECKFWIKKRREQYSNNIMGRLNLFERGDETVNKSFVAPSRHIGTIQEDSIFRIISSIIFLDCKNDNPFGSDLKNV